MERKIHILPVELTLKIAAGEVIERPASILKELLENALDAGATTIRIELIKGGCEGIRIEDNGTGISGDEAPLAFERFATSKIAEFDDLYGVTSYGFRGEALPSIAAIARVELVTKTKDALSGTRIIAEAGQVREISDTGCPVGTSIFVSRIFDTVPVRKKFLKSEATEQGYCMDVIHCAALASDKIKIDVTAGGRHVFSVPATLRMEERVALILGKEALENLMPISGTGDEGLQLRGYIAKPSWSRSSMKHLYCFVNKRFVKDQLINHAVMTAYRNVLEAKRYPVAILHLGVTAGAVDVNVHPAKMEVRFQNPREVYGLIVEALLHALSGLDPDQGGTEAKGPALSAAAYQSRVEEALKRYHLHTGSAKLTFKTPSARSVTATMPLSPPSVFRTDASEATVDFFADRPEKISFEDLTYIGQALNTYLVFTGPEGLILLDQHAAHERILFERLRNSLSGKEMVGQQLLMPDMITLTDRDLELVGDYFALLHELGIQIERFGENALVVKSVPAMLPDLDPIALIRDIIDNALGMEHSPHLQEKKDRLLAVLACRGAVKARHALSESEVTALCRDLDKTAFAATCPHGRPTYVSISQKDLERMFKRR